MGKKHLFVILVSGTKTATLWVSE